MCRYCGEPATAYCDECIMFVKELAKGSRERIVFAAAAIMGAKAAGKVGEGARGAAREAFLTNYGDKGGTEWL